jgi:predicted amidohydrolase
MTDITVAALQFGTGLEPARNVERALASMDELRGGPEQFDLVCLPELFTFRALHTVEPGQIQRYAEAPDSGLTERLAEHARALQTYLVAGSTLRRSDDGQVYNESLVFDRGGCVVATYRKTHLFDAPGHAESDHVAPGDRLVVFDSDFGRVGVVICYELRFPEVARTLALAGANVLAVPNSWPVDGINLGAGQLRTLLRGTALQNLCYVVHANQYGHVAGLDLCGRSCVVDPKGEIVGQASDRDGHAVVARLDLSFVEEIRKVRTTFSHRRPELYTTDAVDIASAPGPESPRQEESA